MTWLLAVFDQVQVLMLVYDQAAFSGIRSGSQPSWERGHPGRPGAGGQDVSVDFVELDEV